jgi:hypothetical protein
MKCILLDGCPAELTFKEPLSNKMEMILRGNSKNFNENPEIVKKTMNKEDRYSHVVPLDILICLLSSYVRHTMQTMVLKEGINPCLCYDASATKKPTDIVMNQITPLACVLNNAPNRSWSSTNSSNSPNLARTKKGFVHVGQMRVPSLSV